jgi:VWFA-related protein
VVRVNTSLVTIPVSVLDRQARHVPTLAQREFRIWEDGVEQQIAYFAAVEKPFTVALVLDTSGSTRFRLDEIQDAAIAFVNQLRADDRVLVVSFDDNIRVLSEATSDRARLRDAIRQTRPGQGTKLYDTVDFIINQRFDRIEGRKAIVLFTDGVDTTSRRASYQSNARDAEELDALIYPIQYDTYDDARARTNSGGGVYGGGTRRRPGSLGGILGDILSGGTISIGRGGGRGGGNNCTGCTREEYERGNAYLNDLARLTGARLYRADATRDLAQPSRSWLKNCAASTASATTRNSRAGRRAPTHQSSRPAPRPRRARPRQLHLQSIGASRHLRKAPSGHAPCLNRHWRIDEK